MALNYPIYDLRTGRRIYYGSTTGSYGDTYGSALFTGPELLHVLRYFSGKGFHVYANKAFGGVNFYAHSSKSWHYVQDGNGISLAADLGTYGDVNERYRIINEVIPVLDRIGMAWHYARDGAVPGHYDHIHLDVSNYGRRGGPAPNYGYYVPTRRQNPITFLGGGYARRKPRSVSAYYGSTGLLVRVIQRLLGFSVRDGSYGPATVKAVKALQKELGVTQDGNFGPVTARAYLARLSPRKEGSRGNAVRLIQYVAGQTVDGSYGPATTKAVKELQTWAGLATDGEFGAAERNRLLI